MKAIVLALFALLVPAQVFAAASAPRSGPTRAVIPKGFVMHLAAVGSSRESGTAWFIPIGKSTKVTLHVTGESAGSSQPALIDFWKTSCANLGAPGQRRWTAGISSSLALLSNVVGGTSTTTLKTSYRTLS